MMRVPSGSSLYRTYRYLAIFVFGTLTGACAFLLLFGEQIDALHVRVRQLEGQNVKYVEEITNLQNAQNNMIQKQKTVVRDIKVLLTAPNALTAVELQRRITKELVFLKGRPLENVAEFHEGIVRLLTNRKYQIGGHVYIANLKTLIVASALEVYMDIKLEKR
ncbi:hypothetical protein PP175_06020 [Aneurinibacillus sp. Ricciae_BoGa-3]|uniref:hypothetical protein n=1 Tax=Aneurinibacillus sp. Ricciae_BoGa-3 TaxID=3022697 RepID=UPI00234060DA|nr:hypothetical protein [Aneurinibacillus sp. Ricciae_BoGa-3]WCK55505.1 hypothetical protein PP175_06020 [Aneurinibacillus sp. Ricciae_BoGa-3]